MNSKMSESPVLTHGQAQALASRMREAKEQRYLEQSRKRLDGIVTIKMKTAFIGALAAFEDEFGFFWGRDVRQEDDLTRSQKEMSELWERARTAVLNNGNNQLRAVRTEIANHVIKWNRYRMDFKVKQQPSRGETDE